MLILDQVFFVRSVARWGSYFSDFWFQIADFRFPFHRSPSLGGNGLGNL